MKLLHPSLFLSGWALVGLASCAPSLTRIQPYERENLSKPVMASDLDPLQKAMTEHAYFSREAAFGGAGVGGGGCGCN